MNRTSPRFLLALGGILLCGCATIISGSNQTITVKSDPAGAKVIVQPGNMTVTAPTSLTLKRNESGYRLRFEKEGYEPVEVRLTSGTNGWVYGNILIGGLFGLLIDYGNGAAYVLRPDHISTNLSPVEARRSLANHARLAVVDRDGILQAMIELE